MGNKVSQTEPYTIPATQHVIGAQSFCQNHWSGPLKEQNVYWIIVNIAFKHALCLCKRRMFITGCFTSWKWGRKAYLTFDWGDIYITPPSAPLWGGWHHGNAPLLFSYSLNYSQASNLILTELSPVAWSCQHHGSLYVKQEEITLHLRQQPRMSIHGRSKNSAFLRSFTVAHLDICEHFCGPKARALPDIWNCTECRQVVLRDMSFSLMFMTEQLAMSQDCEVKCFHIYKTSSKIHIFCVYSRNNSYVITENCEVWVILFFLSDAGDGKQSLVCSLCLWSRYDCIPCDQNPLASTPV